MRKIGVALASALLLTSAVGCSQSHENARGRGDAPVAGRTGDDTPAQCVNMPDEFGNVCGKCWKHFAPWAVASNTSGQFLMFQAPAQCGGTKVPGAQMVASNVKIVKGDG